MGVYIWNKLPSEYQEVEYIQSSGTQYIDTGFYPTGASEIEFDFMMLPGSAYGNFGVDSGWTVNAFSVFSDRLFCYGNQYIGDGLTIYFTPGTRYNLELKSLKCYLNSVLQYTFSSASFTSDYSAYLFAKRRNNTIEMYAKCRVYGLKLWNNGTLERNFIPCYRIADDEVGLYDTVNGVFYTNSGTGTFTKGSDVNNYYEKELKNAYIEEYRVPGANTLFYASLNGNTNSEGTLNPTYNTSSGVTYPTIGDKQYAYINNGKMVWDIGTPSTDVITFQAWASGISVGVIAIGATNWTDDASTGIELYFSGTQWCVYTQNNTSWYGTTSNSNANTWYLITGVKDGTTLSLYKNGALIGSVSCASSFNPKTNVFIADNGNHPIGNISMNVSNIIIEHKARTAQEIAYYYNSTKSNYGL